jgi:predicted transcriptional regulator
MSPSQKSLLPAGGRAVLLSVKPKYVDLILAGTKTVEFRRSWAVQEVGVLVIYASSPVQKLVAIANVDGVQHLSPTRLWKVSQQCGGGLTQAELKAYYAGKDRGFAVMLGKVKPAHKQADPKELFPGFVPPQSFRYLDEKELRLVESKLLGKKRGKA